jgi:2,3,4,5-tetrahydropyridine-2-carboxylate N-succinyltransferase
MQDDQEIIDKAWEERSLLVPGSAKAKKLARPVGRVLEALDQGRLRVAEKADGAWRTHQWIKKAVLLSFRLENNRPSRSGALQFFDKVPTKFERYTKKQFEAGGFRVVPPAVARRGAYIAKNVVLMPSYVNVGAYVDEGTMVDTWATVGSCAQIGKNVHLAGGVGIGGVLEPPNAVPVVIEDDCFVGSRCMIVSGARVRRGAKLGAGVILTDTTPVIEAQTGDEVARGDIPERSVVVQGTRQREFPGGTFGLPCALILRYLDEGVEHDKLKLNAMLRDHGIVS